MNQNQTITPFAMRCTQEQFDDVKEELEKYRQIWFIWSFTYNPILLLEKTFVTNTTEIYCTENNIIIGNWDKSLFLKMAGKPDAESRELIGYKRNPEFDITYKDIGALLRAEFYDFHISDIWEIEDCEGKGSEFFLRARSLGIVGEGKWLVPVYKQEKQARHVGGLRHLTYEQQKRVMI